ncbi:MAG: metallophosphoesterase [Clostridia bacterium]|nr:metallophosphoesterase [Clostridia bacterium]
MENSNMGKEDFIMMLKPNVINLHLGLEKPVRILQLTDVHLSLSDERNKEDMIPYAAGRRDVFFREAEFPERDPIGYLQDAMEYSKGFDCTVITGDLVDFNTYKNYDVAKELLAGKDYMFCAGNHEFTPKPGTDSMELKRGSWDYIQSHFRGNMHIESRIVGGVNIICADNGFRLWTKEQLAVLKAEAARGLPMLVFCHVPIANDMLTLEGKDNARKLGYTEEEIAESVATAQYLVDEPLVKAFFAGHGHHNHYWDFHGKPSYMIGGLFKGIVGEITID